MEDGDLLIAAHTTPGPNRNAGPRRRAGTRHDPHHDTPSGAPARPASASPTVRSPRRAGRGGRLGRRRHGRRARRRCGQLVPRRSGRLPRPEHPPVGWRLLRLRHPEFRGTEPDDQHPGVRLRRWRALEPGEQRRCAADARCVGQAGRHVGTERGPRRRGQRLRHVLHSDGGIHRRPVHRGRHVLVPTGPYRDATSHPVVCDNGVDAGPGHPRQRQLGRQHRPRHLHRQRRDLLAAVEERRESHRSFRPPSGRCSCRRVSKHRSVSRPSCCGTTSRGRATSSRAPTWSRPAWRTSYYLFYAGSDEGASTYAIGWASCPSGPAAGCDRNVELSPARHVPGHVGARRTGRLRTARPASSSWPSQHGRGRRSAIWTAASGPCTWPS